MRGAALLALSLAGLSLSCRMDCDLGTGGVGCEAGGGNGVPGCWSDADCSNGEFCDFTLARCPALDSGVFVLSRIASSACRPIPTDTLGQPCASSDGCAPDEVCVAGTCELVAPCFEFGACPAGCAARREPHVACAACICDC